MMRDRRLIAMFSLVAVLSAGTVGSHLATADGPPVRTVEAHASTGYDGRLTVQFVGDTLLGDGARPVLGRHGYDHPFRPAVARALDGDFVIANAEGPFTHITEPWNKGKDYSYAASPLALAAIRRAGVDALGIDNNHTMDAGPRGLRDTFGFLRSAGLPAFGAGTSLSDAERPLMIRSEAGVVAVVGLGENFGSSVTAKDADPESIPAEKAQAGTVVLSPESVQRGVDLARAAGADWVVAFVHWGDNYMPVNEQQRYWARTLVKAGYDLVVGAGPHIAQPIEVIRGVPVVYSLGNFVFGSPGRFDGFGTVGRGLMVSAEFSDPQGIQLRVRCLVTDNDVVHYRPTLCTPRQSRRLLPGLRPEIVLDRNSGTLQVPRLPRSGVS